MAELDRLEALENEFEEALVSASSSQLSEIGEGLSVTDLQDDMRKTQKMNALRRHVYASWGEEVDKQVSYLESVLETVAAFLKTDTSQHVDVEQQQLEQQRDQDMRDRRQFEQQQQIERQRDHDRRDRQRFGQHNLSSHAPDPPILHSERDHPTPPPTDTQRPEPGQQLVDLLRTLADANISQRRACKIVGVIGGDAKDSKRINYSNIYGQVEDARASGYKEPEIARALKRAISAGSHLRTYFDAAHRQESDPNKMLEVFRDFYNVKTRAELFRELGQVSQNPQEKATDYLLRALELRQRTTASALAEVDGLYDARHVQSTFIRAIRTGFNEIAVKAHMVPFLREDTSDSTLLREMNAAELELEEERDKVRWKSASAGKKVTIAQATAAVSDRVTTTSDNNDALKPILEGILKRMDAFEQDKGATPTRDSGRNSAGERERHRSSWREPSGDRERYQSSRREPSGDRERYQSSRREPSGDRERYQPSRKEPSGGQERYQPSRRDPSGDRGYYQSSQRDQSDARERYQASYRKRSTREKRQCDQCQKDDIQPCWHCFRCCQEGHVASNCSSTSNSKN